MFLSTPSGRTSTRSRVVALACAIGTLLGVLTLAAPTSAQTSEQQPNVVLIVTDDQRWDQIADMPTLQSQLVDQGTEFTNGFVVNPLCCPTRASILTGQYSHTTGVYENGGPYGGFGAFADGSTLATWLHDAGYRTGLIGKYLNGYVDPSYIPPGWDHWRAFSGGSNYLNYTLSVQGTPVDYGDTAADYSTDVLAGLAEDFIETTPAEQPMFMMFTPFAPHAGWIPPARYAGAFPDFEGIRPPNLNEADVSDKPAWVQSLPYEPGDTYDTQRRRQAQTLLAVDDAIGRILASLDAAGRTGETLFVFTSDNGLSSGSHRWARKTTPWDETIRVPFVVRYDPLEQVATEDRFALDVDIAPTIAGLAGIEAPGAEGASLLPLLDGTATAWRDRFLVEHHASGIPTSSPPSYCAVRTSQYKFIRYTTGEEELYDLAADPYELESRHADPAFAEIRAGLFDDLVELCSPPPPDYTFGEPEPGALVTPTDAAVATGLWDGVNIRSYGSFPMDLDVDGQTDVLMVPHVAKAARLLHNDGGTFTLAASPVFPKRDRHGCAAADVDLNGLPDVYCTLGADSGTAAKANELWMQTTPGEFVDRAGAWGVADPYGRGREVAFLDVNRDDLPDLYVTNAYPRSDGIASPNRLFVNVDGTTFRPAPEYGLDVEVGGILGTQTCVQVVDVNADGWPDLLVCGKAGLKMYVHDGVGAYTDRRAALTMPTGVFFDAVLADMDGDGVKDLVGLSKTKLRVFLRTGGLFRAAAYSIAVAHPRQIEVADLDLDADPDIYAVTGASSGKNLADLLLENDGTGRRFRSVPALTATGDGQSVAAVDHDGDGSLALIVMNGFKTVAGPVQLLVFPVPG